MKKQLIFGLAIGSFAVLVAGGALAFNQPTKANPVVQRADQAVAMTTTPAPQDTPSPAATVNPTPTPTVMAASTPAPTAAPAGVSAAQKTWLQPVLICESGGNYSYVGPNGMVGSGGYLLSPSAWKEFGDATYASASLAPATAQDVAIIKSITAHGTKQLGGCASKLNGPMPN